MGDSEYELEYSDLSEFTCSGGMSKCYFGAYSIPCSDSVSC